MIRDFEKETWWHNNVFKICQHYNEEWGVGNIYMNIREDGSYEYALVDWRYQTPSLNKIIHNGKVIYGSEE